MRRLAVILVSLWPLAALGAEGSPLPAPKPVPQDRTAPTADSNGAEDDDPAPQPSQDRLAATDQEPEPSACLSALRALDVTYEALKPIAQGRCGSAYPLKVSAIGSVELVRPATLRCDAALALARWTTQVVAPAAVLHLGQDVREIRVAASYNCRTRRTAGGSTRLSEHARANAIDVSGVRLADGAEVAIAERLDSAAPERAFQAAIRGGACVLFTTVIGPQTNALHADHLHLDRAKRRGNGRLCQ